MQNNNTHAHVSRHEFEAAMKRIEALLDTQTKILIQLAGAETDNKHRDSKIDEAIAKADKANAAVAQMKLLIAKVAGGFTVVVFVLQIVLKKLNIF